MKGSWRSLYIYLFYLTTITTFLFSALYPMQQAVPFTKQTPETYVESSGNKKKGFRLIYNCRFYLCYLRFKLFLYNYYQKMIRDEINKTTFLFHQQLYFFTIYVSLTLEKHLMYNNNKIYFFICYSFFSIYHSIYLIIYQSNSLSIILTI